MKTDRQILAEVRQEWTNGAGFGLSARAVLQLLQQLDEGFGEDLKLDGVITALSRLSKIALLIKGSIEDKRSENGV